LSRKPAEWKSTRGTATGRATTIATRSSTCSLPSTSSTTTIATSQFLQTSIQKLTIQQKKVPVIDAANTELKSALREADRFHTENDTNQSIVAIDLTKNPDLWLARTGWTSYLATYVPSNIVEASSDFEVGSDGKRIEDQLVKSLKSIESEVQSIDRTHIVFQTVKCRPHQPWPSSAFALPSSKSFDCYFTVMKILYRIIFRVNEAVPNNNIYPRMILTAQQKDLYEIMKLYPANLEAVSDFWLSFACQSYDNSPYECALICAIAMSSIKKRNSAFKTFANITGTFAALLTVHKILVIYKSKISATSYKSMNSFVQEFTRLYLSHPEDGLTETPNAISWIIGTHCYAKAASTMETKIGRLIWDNDTLVYRNIRLRLVDLRSAVSKKVAEGEQIMSQLCDVNSFLNLSKIPWDSTLDHKLVANTEHKYGRSTFLWTDDIVTDAWSDSTWCSDKLSLVLSSSFRKTIGVGINIANFRHIAIAIYRKFIIATNKSEKFTNGGESDDEDQEVTADEYWDLQAGHKSSTARNVYARLETEHGASSSTVIDFFRSVSEN
jgi:hypothetical protein